MLQCQAKGKAARSPMELPDSWASSLSAWGCSCHTLCAAFPSAEPPEPACLPILAPLHRDLFLQRPCWGSTALQRRYPQEMSGSVFSRCLQERAIPSGVSVQPQVQLFWLQYPLKYCKAEHVEASKPQLSESVPTPPVPNIPFLTFSKKYSSVSPGFWVLYGHASAVPWGQTTGSVACPWPVWFTSHTNTFRFLTGIKYKFLFWAVHPSPLRLLKVRLFPCGTIAWARISRWKIKFWDEGLLGYMLLHKVPQASCLDLPSVPGVWRG